MNTAIIVSQLSASDLSASDRAAIQVHHLALSADDRRLRFGVSASDASLCAYVAGMDFARDATFGIFNDRFALAGTAHLARGDGIAELGVSVLPEHRRRGLAGALLARAHAQARKWGAKALTIHCLAENVAMVRLARRGGLAVRTRSGEADGYLPLLPTDAAATLMDEEPFPRVARQRPSGHGVLFAPPMTTARLTVSCL